LQPTNTAGACRWISGAEVADAAMNVRILNIAGTGSKSREKRLRQVEAWMKSHGWELMDYSDELGSAAFERAPAAPPLGWFDATRWMPAPDWMRPGAWLRRSTATPRQMAFAGGICLAVGAAFVLLLSATNSGSSLSVKGAGGQGEAWHYVAVGWLNVRAEPVSGAQIVGVLYRNQRVLVGETEKGWARIIKPERGFVAAQFLLTHPVQ